MADGTVPVEVGTSLPAEANARYARQILLAEVGRQGQAKVLAATACVGGQGLAHRVAVRYALRAGFAAVLPGEIATEALAPAAIVKYGASREVLAGARVALRAFLGAVRDA